MKIFLVFSLCVASVLASGEWDDSGGGFHGFQQVHGGIKAPAFILPIPEIGLTLDKIPILLPIPSIVLRKNPTLISKPVSINLGHNFGFGGGHGGGMKFGGGHGGGMKFGGGHGGGGMKFGGMSFGGHGW